MKSITVETLSGKKFFIENVGSCFMINDEIYFTDIISCMKFILSNS